MEIVGHPTADHECCFGAAREEYPHLLIGPAVGVDAHVLRPWV